MYGNTTAAQGERRVHRTALALIQGGYERNVQYPTDVTETAAPSNHPYRNV